MNLAMEDMIQGLVAKVGISKEQAEKVIEFFKENAHRVPELLKSDQAKAVLDKLPGGLGDKIGGMF
jgi:hypothetical protein